MPSKRGAIILLKFLDHTSRLAWQQPRLVTPAACAVNPSLAVLLKGLVFGDY